jgi:CMP-N,N'-diacetyllegionaminic acid synthase
MALINGRPLVAIAIDAAIEAGIFTQIIVSTNDHNVAKLANQYAVTSLERPDDISNDLATADSVIAHTIEVAKPSDGAIIVYLQPTSPLRKATHINESLDIFLQTRPKAIVSVRPASSEIFKAYKLDNNGSLTGLFGPDAPYCARQQIPPIFLPNGAIYIFTVADFLIGNRQIPRSGISPFIMDDIASLDIDTAEDLALASASISNNE